MESETEESISETEDELDSMEEEENQKQKEKDAKKKPKKKTEKAVKTKKDDGKKPAAGAAKKSGLGLGARQLKAKQEEEERLRKEEAEIERLEELRKEREKKEKKKQKEMIIIMSIIMIISLLIACYFSMFNKSKYGDDRLSRWEASFAELVDKYGPALPNASQKVINKNIQRILNRTTSSIKFNQDEPAVILLIGSNQNADAVRCIYQSLSLAISKVFNESRSPVIKAEKITNKLDLHNEILNIFGPKKLHAVIIDGIERLNGKAAMSLHPFTDHDNAAYLDVILFLTAYTDTPLTNLETNQTDKIANDLLELSWANIPEEQVQALLSRVTPSVALVSDTNESSTWKCE